MSYTIIDREGLELATFPEVTDATRASRKIASACAVISGDDGVLLARVVRGTVGEAGEPEAARAAHRWRQQRRKDQKVA